MGQEYMTEKRKWEDVLQEIIDDPYIKNSIYEKVFSDIVDTPITKNELGDSAGVFGACML